MLRQIARLVVVAALGWVSSQAFADQFHYNNVLSGDRSMGLGGAYAGVSDDASGIVYNPAGLAFALSNDVSASANAFFQKNIEYKKTIGEKSFKEESSGQLAPFFGGLQKLDHISPGLVIAFGIYTTDSELKEQDDRIAGVQNIVAFKRTAALRASTTYFGFAAAKRVSSKLSFGLGMNYIKVDELLQEYQDATTVYAKGTNPDKTYYRIFNQGIRQRLIVNAIQPVLGVQFTPIAKVSLGLSVKAGMITSETYETYKQATWAITDGQSNVVTKAEDDASELDLGEGKINDRTSGYDADIKDAMKEWPMEIRAGMAFFANPRLLWTFDVIHHGKTGKGKISNYKREAITNFATGVEYYVTPMIPLRFGLLSNYDARPTPKAGKTGQADHIDYYGATIFVGWVQPNSQVSIGLMTQMGEGKAQKIGGTTEIQDVVAMSNTFAFSATHSF